jgi:hypothetical protein
MQPFVQSLLLADGMRASAWVCADGVTPPLVDWQPSQPTPLNSR